MGGLRCYANEIDKLTLYIGGSAGGGFDQTGMAMRDALLAEGIVDKVEIIRSPGAGGLIGLAQFIESKKGDPNAIFIGGRTNIGATLFNKSKVSLLDVQPIARLNEIVLVIAVPQNSKIADMGDLIATLRTDPGLVKWAGGSAGSVDELLILEIVSAIGVDRSRIDYRAVPGGGEDVVKHVISGQSTVAVSSFEELKSFGDTGELRFIGVSSKKRLPVLAAPTLNEYGIDVDFSDWKGVFAPQGLSEGQVDSLSSALKQLSKSPSWSEALNQHEWQNVFLSGDSFTQFVSDEMQRIEGLKRNELAGDLPVERIAQIVSRQYRWLIFSLGFIGVLFAALFVQRHLNRRRQENLQASLLSAEDQLEKKLTGATGHIEDEFTKWKLTDSEIEIGWMLLKGLSFKEIAKARGTSERTVRQQARSIYAKSGLSSRSDLAAYFFEDFVFGALAS